MDNKVALKGRGIISISAVMENSSYYTMCDSLALQSSSTVIFENRFPRIHSQISSRVPFVTMLVRFSLSGNSMLEGPHRTLFPLPTPTAEAV